NWGDGTTSAGELAHLGPYAPGTQAEDYQVKGTHTYQQLASHKPITVTVLGQTFLGNGKVTAEANVYAMPSGISTPPPSLPPLSGTPANVVVQLEHLNSGVYFNTQVGDTTLQMVGSFLAQFNGQADLTQEPLGHFGTYINWGNSSAWTAGVVVYKGINGTR